MDKNVHGRQSRLKTGSARHGMVHAALRPGILGYFAISRHPGAWNFRVLRGQKTGSARAPG